MNQTIDTTNNASTYSSVWSGGTVNFENLPLEDVRFCIPSESKCLVWGDDEQNPYDGAKFQTRQGGIFTIVQDKA